MIGGNAWNLNHNTKSNQEQKHDSRDNIIFVLLCNETIKYYCYDREPSTLLNK